MTRDSDAYALAIAAATYLHPVDDEQPCDRLTQLVAASLAERCIAHPHGPGDRCTAAKHVHDAQYVLRIVRAYDKECSQ